MKKKTLKKKANIKNWFEATVALGAYIGLLGLTIIILLFAGETDTAVKILLFVVPCFIPFLLCLKKYLNIKYQAGMKEILEYIRIEKKCAICEQKLRIFSKKAMLTDGFVCKECLWKVDIPKSTNLKSHTCQSAKELIERRTSIIDSFNPTKEVGRYLSVDETHKTFQIKNQTFEYSNLLTFELLENGQSITSGGLGGAVVGGALFGGVGAIVGSNTGVKKSSSTCISLKLRVTLKDTYVDTIFIDFIRSETLIQSPIYKRAQKNAQSCVSALEIICDYNKEQKQTDSINKVYKTNETISEADELLKFKQLLDAGVITQAEFDAKKKQILNL